MDLSGIHYCLDAQPMFSDGQPFFCHTADPALSDLQQQLLAPPEDQQAQLLDGGGSSPAATPGNLQLLVAPTNQLPAGGSSPRMAHKPLIFEPQDVNYLLNTVRDKASLLHTSAQTHS